MWGSMKWWALHCHLLHILQHKYINLLSHSSGHYWSYISRFTLLWAHQLFSPEQTLTLSSFMAVSWKFLKNKLKWMTSLYGRTSKINLLTNFDTLVKTSRQIFLQYLSAKWPPPKKKCTHQNHGAPCKKEGYTCCTPEQCELIHVNLVCTAVQWLLRPLVCCWCNNTIILFAQI